ncbi:MAG: YIP1 family protein [Anaerolineae bacterium]|nr:YIP1 family protein [Anaerolineae bacterium]
MFERIMGVFKLNPNTFEEIEHDQSATGQAAIIVAIVALLNGLGGGISASMNPQGGGNFFLSFILFFVWAFIGWAIWSGVTYLVGTSLFGGKADMGEMLRVIGFAQAPQVLGIIPCIGIIGAFWALAAGFVAVRQGLDLDNTKAFFTILIGFLVYLAGFCAILSLVGGAGAFVGSLGQG